MEDCLDICDFCFEPEWNVCVCIVTSRLRFYFINTFITCIMMMILLLLFVIVAIKKNSYLRPANHVIQTNTLLWPGERARFTLHIIDWEHFKHVVSKHKVFNLLFISLTHDILFQQCIKAYDTRFGAHSDLLAQSIVSHCWMNIFSEREFSWSDGIVYLLRILSIVYHFIKFIQQGFNLCSILESAWEITVDDLKSFLWEQIAQADSIHAMASIILILFYYYYFFIVAT